MRLEEQGDAGREQVTRLLVVDDESTIRDIVERSLRRAGHESIDQADSVPSARARIACDGPFAVVLLDIRMPGEPGTKLLEELAPLAPQTVVIVATGTADIGTAIEALKAGAYDYLIKPFIPDAIQLSVARALRKRRLELDALDRQQQIQTLVQERTATLEATRHALLESLCHLAEFRDVKHCAHLYQIPEYARILAQDMALNSPYAGEITGDFVAHLVESAPLHDIGKVGVPDAILLKPGPLTSEEFEQIKQHTVLGMRVCQSVKRRIGADRGDFIDAAIKITGSHHERWDGTGYPSRLKATNIPLVGRIVHLADFYDACRSPRPYRPEPVPQDEVVRLILAGTGTDFDPVVVDAFRRTRPQFAELERKWSP